MTNRLPSVLATLPRGSDVTLNLRLARYVLSATVACPFWPESAGFHTTPGPNPRFRHITTGFGTPDAQVFPIAACMIVPQWPGCHGRPTTCLALGSIIVGMRLFVL